MEGKGQAPQRGAGWQNKVSAGQPSPVPPARRPGSPSSSTSLPARFSACTAWSWVAWRRSVPFTDRMASPSRSARLWSAASPGKILEMRIGIRFSRPPLMLMPRPPASCFTTRTRRTGGDAPASPAGLRGGAGGLGGPRPRLGLPGSESPAPPPFGRPLKAAAAGPRAGSDSAAAASPVRLRLSPLSSATTRTQRSLRSSSTSPALVARVHTAMVGPAPAASVAAATLIPVRQPRRFPLPARGGGPGPAPSGDSLFMRPRPPSGGVGRGQPSRFREVKELPAVQWVTAAGLVVWALSHFLPRTPPISPPPAPLPCNSPELPGHGE